MAGRALIALSAAMLAAGAAGAQTAFFDVTQGSTELESTEDARLMFAQLTAEPLTPGDPREAAMIASNARYEPMSLTLQRGPGRQGPAESAADLRAAAWERDGGLHANMAVATSRHGEMRIYFEDVPPETLVPPAWQLLATRGEPFSADGVQIEIARLSDKVIRVERIVYRRDGNRQCRSHAESRLYADPAVAATYHDVGVFFDTVHALSLLDRQVYCRTTSAPAPGLYIVRHYDGDGRALPHYDIGFSPFRIVPRTPVPAVAEPG